MAIDLRESFNRIKAGYKGEFDTTQTADWIQKHLKLSGRQVSFKGREYQERILKSDAPTIVVKKCSQVGISELMLMRNLALMDILNGFKIIHTLPTALFAQKVMKTRVDPLLASSQKLQSKLNKNLDNASVKQIGDSLLYLNGTNTTASAISIPADCIVVDELDFSVMENVESLQSRLTASQYRWWNYVSTPTVPNFGIDSQFQASKRYYNHCKCKHCGRWYLPDFLKHTRIPGFEGDLLTINKGMLGSIHWQEAEMFCPHCGKPADLSIEHRAWVCENPSDNFLADGFQISPTDAPSIITPADLVLWSTRFKRKVNFVNYHLGQVMADNDSGINEADLDLMEQVGSLPASGFRVFGLDMGTECHLTVGVTDGQGKLTVIEKHRLDYRTVEEELNRLSARHRPTTILADSQPYVETIHRLQSRIHNLYGSVYVTTKDMQPYRVIDQSEDTQKALLDRRQVNVNRNVALNILMDDIRSGLVGVTVDAEQDLFRQQMQDMKRKPASAKAFNGEASDEDGEPEAYVWVKTTGNDHYHHSLLYCHIAAQLVHHLPGRGALPCFIGSFKVKSER